MQDFVDDIDVIKQSQSVSPSILVKSSKTDIVYRS